MTPIYKLPPRKNEKRKLFCLLSWKEKEMAWRYGRQNLDSLLIKSSCLSEFTWGYERAWDHNEGIPSPEMNMATDTIRNTRLHHQCLRVPWYISSKGLAKYYLFLQFSPRKASSIINRWSLWEYIPDMIERHGNGRGTDIWGMAKSLV